MSLLFYDHESQPYVLFSFRTTRVPITIASGGQITISTGIKPLFVREL